jgi:quercetin dioxygenase-like cupin family protein
MTPEPEPRTVPLDQQAWEVEAAGIRSRARDVAGNRWAIVEYARGARRDEWCTDGHRGLVLDGHIRYDFDDGTPPLEAAGGQAFLLPQDQGHRGTNVADGPTRLFLIDGPTSPAHDVDPALDRE